MNNILNKLCEIKCYCKGKYFEIKSHKAFFYKKNSAIFSVKNGIGEEKMKILALETETPGVAKDRFKPFLKEEARKVWELYQEGTLRELYFRTDTDAAVLILECDSIKEAEGVLATLPLVKENLISFQLIALKPYPGFKRLFEEEA